MAPPVAYLPMVWQLQKQSNWCWAAVTSMICQFYDPESYFNQCSVATATINQWRQSQNPPRFNCDCCNPAVAPTNLCNVTWGLQPPLQLVGHFGGMQGRMSLDDVLNELAARRPVCVHIQWAGGGGHFIVANGALKVDFLVRAVPLEIVFVEDPALGPGDYAYDTLAQNYQGSGMWATTFTTVP